MKAATLILAILIPTGLAWADEPELYKRARPLLQGIDKEVQEHRARILREFTGKEHGEGFNDAVFPKLTEETLRQWYAPEEITDLVKSLDANLAEFKKQPGISLDEFTRRIYGSVRGAISGLWALHCRERGPQGWSGILTAQYQRAYYGRCKTWDDERAAIRARFKDDSDGAEAATRELYRRLAEDQLKEMEAVAKSYRELGRTLQETRRRLCGDMWRWQDIAFRRSAVADDVHDIAQREFRAAIEFSFDPMGPESMGALRVSLPNLSIAMSRTMNFADEEQAARWPDLQTSRWWLFSYDSFVSESVDSLLCGSATPRCPS